MIAAPATTCQLVRICPCCVSTIPVPQPPPSTSVASTRTMDRRSCMMISAHECCVSDSLAGPVVRVASASAFPPAIPVGRGAADTAVGGRAIIIALKKPPHVVNNPARVRANTILMNLVMIDLLYVQHQLPVATK